MRKMLLFRLFTGTQSVVLAALVVSCSTNSDDTSGVSPSSGESSTSGSFGSSSPRSDSSSTQPTTSSSGGSSTGPGSSGGSSSTAAHSTQQASSGPSTQTAESDTALTSSDSSPAGGEGTSDLASTESGDGSTSTDVSTSTGGSGTSDGMTDTDDTMPTNNAPVPSDGCENANGLETLTTGGMSVSGGLPTSTKLRLGDREYIIDIPADYDPTHPHRLIFSWHQAYGSANGNAVGQYPANPGNNFDAQNYAYFGLHREATAANEPAIFVAPQGIGNFPWEYDRDVALFDDLLELIDANLCVDESRVFSTGFSFGAMMSHALSIGRQSKLRAVVAMAPANYNFTQPPNSHAPFAYMGITGMSDGTCPWVRNGNSTTEGGKYCVLQHAEDNGCTIPADIMTAMNGSKNHVCYDFEGCQAGYPVKVCTFDGNHTPSAVADGMSGGDDGLNAFVPPLAWEFISQF